MLWCAGLRARLDIQKDGLYLYRNMLPLGISSIAFVGCEVSRGSPCSGGGLTFILLLDFKSSILDIKVQHLGP